MSGVTISLEGKRALVTGGANGLGAEIVRTFAAAGGTGAAVDLATAADLPVGWVGLAADVTSEVAVHDACAAAVAQLGGRLDVVVAAAGIVPPWSHTDEIDLEEWDRVFAINARGVIATLKHAVPLMNDGGAIVLMASLNAWRGDGNIAGYVASKHAVLGIARATAIDLGRRGIRVNAIGPGPIATEALLSRMHSRAAGGGLAPGDALAGAAAMTSLGRIATAQDVAGTALFLVSELSAGMTGQLLPVDGGLP
jgi:NAD(P)-dependent dehydrogenase (short-subunit alcohol dehydrogenase family)